MWNLPIDNDMLDNMKRDIRSRSPVRLGSILNSGFKRIPSVEKFDLTSTVLNSLLRKVGLKRKLPRKAITKVNWDTYDLNKYLAQQINRLLKLRNAGRMKEYWKIVMHLLRDSEAFRISAFNRVFPSWYRTMPLHRVYSLNKGIHRILTTWDDSLTYHRVYIAKDGKDQYRPLGVPSDSWRVVMHMWNNFLTMAIRPELEKFNHGFMPGRGTTTAWKELIERVLDKKYIYEFDLKQFFSGVSHIKVLETLQKLEVPDKGIDWLCAVNTTLVNLPKTELLDESLEKDSWYNTYEALRSWGDIMEEELNMTNILEEMAKKEGHSDVYEMAKYFHDVVWKGAEGGKLRGLPQGLNTSPILSISTLIDWYKELKNRNIELLMYADDGLMYSNEPFDPYFDPLVIKHEDKSGWVKLDGTWQKELIYLGLKYNQTTDELEGNTRRGSRLKFGRLQKNIPEFLKEIVGVSSLKEGTSLKYLANSSILSLVQSRLYSGSWDVIEGVEKDWEIHPESWWGLKSRTEKLKGHPTLSSSAIKTLHEIIWGAMNRQTARYLRQVIIRSKKRIF